MNNSEQNEPKEPPRKETPKTVNQSTSSSNNFSEPKKSQSILLKKDEPKIDSSNNLNNNSVKGGPALKRKSKGSKIDTKRLPRPILLRDDIENIESFLTNEAEPKKLTE